MSEDDFPWDLDADASNRLARITYSIGKELGRELKLFDRFSRGELEWEDLTDLQRTLYLGGDRTRYEALRMELRKEYRSSARSAGGAANPVADSIEYDNLPLPRIDFGKF